MWWLFGEGGALGEPPSALFQKRPKPASISPQQLEDQCVLRRESLKVMRGTLDPSDLKDLLDKTTSEVQAGCMTGPYHSEREVTAQLGTNLWSLSSRFLLRQGETARFGHR